MVEPVSGSGGVTPIKNAASNKSVDKNKAGDETRAATPTDEVQISSEAQEALSTAQAEQTARDVRSELQKDLDLVLGIDPSFAEQV